MKSIKETADYLYQGYGTNPNRKALRENFIQGANYVLDEVECILEENKLSDCEEICNELIALIEQLKK